MHRLFALIFGSLLIGALTPLWAQQASPRSKTQRKPVRMTVSQLEWAVFDLVNAERKKKGLGELRWNSDLAGIARKHSEKMAKMGLVGHYEDEMTLSERVRKAGFTSWTALGENVSQNRGYDNPAKAAVEKWMLSEGHRKSIVDVRWDVTGVGVAFDSKGQAYLTQEFARMR